jgi:hypothetical protein
MGLLALIQNLFILKDRGGIQQRGRLGNLAGLRLEAAMTAKTENGRADPLPSLKSDPLLLGAVNCLL